MAARADYLLHLSRALATGVGELFDFPVGNNLSLMVRAARLDYDVNGAVVCAMILACARIPDSPLKRQDPNPRALSVETSDDEGNAIVTDDLSLVRELPRANFLRAVQQAGESADAWLRDLTMCHQVSALNDRNCVNYFAAMNGTPVNGRDILMVLEVSKNLLPKLVDLPDMRSGVTNLEFIRYHIAYSSTPGLVQRMIDDLTGLIEVSDATRARVQRAIDQFWDRDASNAIPKKAVAMAHAYLRTMNMLPANWYQGEKAASTTNAVVYAQWRNAFARWRDLNTSTDATGVAMSNAEILDAVGRDTLTL